ncbi:MAG: amino acid ABC transporter permease [Chloroflexota bacterium]
MNPGALLAVQDLQFQFDLPFFLNFVFNPSPALIGGLAITIYVAVIAQLMGIALGILSALAGMSRQPVLRWVSGMYVWFFRGTPVLVQIFLVYFGTPYLLGGLDLFPNHIQIGPLDLHGAIMAGLVALGINEGAYMSEIVRAGILSVDTGQAEAAKSLGMTYRLTMSRIVLPQAMRVIIPPLGNEFNNMIKTTSLLSIIAVGDLFLYAQTVNSATFHAFEAYFGVALYYLLLTTIWSWIQSRIERRLGQSTRGDDRASPIARLIGFRGRKRMPDGLGDGGLLG